MQNPTVEPSAQPEHAAADQCKVFAEQVSLVYQLGTTGAITVIAIGWLYVMLVWQTAPQSELLLWASVVTLLSGVRIALAYIRKRRAINDSVREWAWGLAALALATGFLWSYAAIALFPYGERGLHLIAAFILLGIPAGGVATFGPYAASYACYLVATLLPFGIAVWLRGDDFSGWLLLASVVYGVFLFRVGYWMQATLCDNIAQRLHLERMAQGLAQARDAAEVADRAKSSFLANMSHELRTPLNAVVGMNELLLASSLTGDQRQQVKTGRDAAMSLMEMLDSVLDLSRLEAGKLDLHEVSFDPHAMLTQLEHLYRPVAQRKALTFGVSIAPDAPHALLGDPMRWRQVLGILLDNAIKFTEHGSVFVVVEAREESGGVCALRAEVTDTGIGISPEDRKLLFQRFSQIDASSTRRHGGTGAGLGIAADLAVVMGGDVGVNSEKGKGARFWFVARMKLPPAQ